MKDLQKTIFACKMMAEAMPAHLQEKLVTATTLGSAEFIGDHGIDAYMFALKDADEGTQVLYCEDGEPTGDVATIIEYIGGQNTNVTVRFEINGQNMRMSAHDFARSFRTMPCSDSNEAATRALVRGYFLGKWMRENGVVTDDEEAEAGAFVEMLGEAGIVPEAPQSDLPKSLLAKAQPESAEEAKPSARQSQAAELARAVLQDIFGK